MRTRRRSKTSRMAIAASKPPLRAATAARWETLETLEVAWDWRLAAASVTSGGAIIQPTRHPVMA